MATARKKHSSTTTITLVIAGVGAVGALLSGLAAAGTFGSHQPAPTSARTVATSETVLQPGQAVVVPTPPAAVVGSVVAWYSIDLASEYGITLTAGSQPQPTQAGWLQADLLYSGGTFNSDGRLAPLDATTVSYTTCKGDTRYTNFIQNPTHLGSTYCFTGHAVTAAIHVTALGPMSTEPYPDYLTLDVTVWQDS